MENPSAYPLYMEEDGLGGVTDPGATLLDYFAARAPKDILWEFKLKMGERPEPIWPEGKRQQDDEPKNWKELADYTKAANIERIQMWPWEWAKAMLEQREDALLNL